MDSYNDNLHKKSSPVLYEYAKQMRRNATEAEELLWLKLKNRQVGGKI
jgi:very-short-patch-repair endonuclease